MEGVISTEGETGKFRVAVRQGHLSGEAGVLSGRLPQTLIRKFLTDWVRIPLLGEAETAIVTY